MMQSNHKLLATVLVATVMMAVAPKSAFGSDLAHSGLSQDETALVEIANSFSHTCKPESLDCVEHLGIVGKYALVGYAVDSDSMTTIHFEAFIAIKRDGFWRVIQRGEQFYSQYDLLHYAPAMGSAQSAKLEDVAYKRWSHTKW